MNNKTKPKQKGASHEGQLPKTMSNKPLQKNNEPVPIFHQADQSIPHHDLGMVQPGVTASMEPHFSPNSREPRSGFFSADSPDMARVGKSLVEIPNG